MSQPRPSRRVNQTVDRDPAINPVQRQVKRKPLCRAPRKAVWAGGSVATLALLAVVPTTGTPLPATSCQEVVRSGAEISRGQLSQLVAVSEGEAHAAVRSLINEPYCLLPVAADAEEKAGDENAGSTTAREAYPLAFDPEAWVVVNYELGQYVDYDFVFKP